MAGPVERVMAERVAADPVTAALAELVGGVVREVLTEHLPKLTVTQQEAARMLSVSTKTVGEFVAEGRLHRVGDRPACPITFVMNDSGKSTGVSRLQAWRLEHGLTLRELSDIGGPSVPYLSRLERGERQMAPLTKVQFARRLGVPVSELFEVDPLTDDATPEPAKAGR